MAGYLGALVVLVVAALLAGAALRVGAPSRSARGNAHHPYEGGGRTGHKTWVQFRIRYAVWALVFVAFDMEMVYMFPWAVVFKRFGIMAFLDMFVFLIVLAAALAFAWKEGALTWER